MKKIFILLTGFYFLLSNTLANENIFIVAKINNEILTNFDLKKETAYLNILNPQLENLDKKAFDKINKFFETMPQLRKEIEIENPKTKVMSKVVLKGAQDFFVLPSLTTA